MLYETSNFDPKPIETAATRLWRLAETDRAEMLVHVRAGLRQGSPEMRLSRDEVIIKHARQILAAARTL
jgi:hypothetical protein